MRTTGDVEHELTQCKAELKAAIEREVKLKERASVYETALRAICSYPVHSEPVCGAMVMQDLAHDVLKDGPSYGGKGYVSKEELGPTIEAITKAGHSGAYCCCCLCVELTRLQKLIAAEPAPMVKAPAICPKCNVRFESPTAGMLLPNCPICGTELQSLTAPEVGIPATVLPPMKEAQ